MPSTPNHRVDHVVDVDGMQPDRSPADGTKAPPEHRAEESKKMQIARSVDKARPDDDGGEARPHGVAHGELCLSLRRLINVGGSEWGALVSRLCTGDEHHLVRTMEWRAHASASLA